MPKYTSKGNFYKQRLQTETVLRLMFSLCVWQESKARQLDFKICRSKCFVFFYFSNLLKIRSKRWPLASVTPVSDHIFFMSIQILVLEVFGFASLLCRRLLPTEWRQVSRRYSIAPFFCLVLFCLSSSTVIHSLLLVAAGYHMYQLWTWRVVKWSFIPNWDLESDEFRTAFVVRMKPFDSNICAPDCP